MARFRIALPGAMSLICLACLDDTPTSFLADDARLLSQVPEVQLEMGSPLESEWARLATGTVPGFAGLFIDEDGVLVASGTDPESQDRALAVARGWANDREQAPTSMRFRLVEYDFGELKLWRDKLMNLVGNGDVTFLDLDEVANRVVVGVRPGTAAQRIRSETSSRGVPDGALEVIDYDTPIFDSSLQDTLRPIIGGYEIERWGGQQLLQLRFHNRARGGHGLPDQ